MLVQLSKVQNSNGYRIIKIIDKYSKNDRREDLKMKTLKYRSKNFVTKTTQIFYINVTSISSISYCRITEIAFQKRDKYPVQLLSYSSPTT